MKKEKKYLIFLIIFYIFFKNNFKIFLKLFIKKLTSGHLLILYKKMHKKTKRCLYIISWTILHDSKFHVWSASFTSVRVVVFLFYIYILQTEGESASLGSLSVEA